MKVHELNIFPNGDVLLKHFGRFRSNLVIVGQHTLLTEDQRFPSEILDFDLCAQFDLPLGTNGRVYFGYYFISKNKNKCFRVTDKDKAKYALLDLYYTGKPYVIKEPLYEHFALDDTNTGAQWVAIKLQIQNETL